MKKIIVFIVMVTSILITGCTDIPDSGIADFGTTKADQDVLGHFNDVYGDITQKGAPRILEPMVTTNIEENLPIDKVLEYSNKVSTLYLWFVYDNFEENDPIKIEWKYDEKDKIIKTFNTKAGDDFGRGSFSLEKPEDLPENMWPLGKYTITISGKGVTKTVEFTVIDGETSLTELPWEDYVSTDKTAETQKADPGNTPDSKTYDELYTNNNIGACSFTDKSTFELSGKAYVSKIRMWYYWDKDEKQLPFTLKKEGKEIISGVLMREGCDPYQTSWCEGNYYPKKDFEAGTYELKVQTAKLCQNSQSNGNGMYAIYGKDLSEPVSEQVKDNTEESLIGIKTESGFTIAKADCSFAGDWSSNWGDMKFEETDNIVTGTYTHNQGKITGTMKGNIMIGTWSESPSYKPSNDAGDIEIELSADCKTFTGNWRYGSTGSWSGDWTGTRK